MFKSKLPKPEQGFTMVEVLIAIFIATIFVAVTMQMMAIAAMFKVRAQENAEATTWIQQDLENVKYQAANYQYTFLTADANSTNVLSVASFENFRDFQAGDTLIVGTDSTNNTINTGGIDTTNKTITLTTAMDTNWLTDTPLAVTTRCKPATQNAGFADGLRDWINDTNHIDGITDVTNSSDYLDIPKTSSLHGKSFTIRRTTTLSSSPPYNLLQIKYEVSSGSTFDSSKVIASYHTEVIPNAALQCPN